MLAVSAGLAAGLASLLSGSDSSPPAPQPRAALAEVHAVSAAQAAAFGILRRPRTAADSFVQIHQGAGPFGSNPSLARTLSEPLRGLSRGFVSVIPGNGWVCLRLPITPESVYYNCQPTARAAGGALVITQRPPGPLRASNQLVVGLVPDGVRAVTIKGGDGVAHRVAVRQNVYDVELFDPRTVSMVLPGGRAVHLSLIARTPPRP